jgi:hypothetical protein
MRLARLAAVGLAIGVFAGFAVALLRPRPQVRADSTPGAPPRAEQSEQLQQREHEAVAKRGDGEPAERPEVLDIRAPRRVNG